MKKQLILAFAGILFINALTAQNTGIGITTPEAKLHVNGDLKLQNGFAVNKFSRDSLFTENSHNNVPTEKAIKDYVQKGNWVTAASTAGSQAPLARGITSEWLNGPNSVYTSGSHCFVSSRNSNELVIFNISKPDSIYVRDRDATNLDVPVDVFVQGNFAYVVCEGNDRLCIFDVSNPGAIVPKAFTSVNMRVPTSVFVQGNYAYVTSDLANRLSVYDISDPNNIVAKGFTSVNMNFPTDVFVSGNFAYLVASSNNRLCVYDISNPNAPVARGFISTSLSDPRSVVVKDNYAYVTSFGNNRLCVFNVTNPDVITASGFISTSLSQPTGLSVTGNYAFIANTGYNSVNLYDISNPASLRYIGLSQANLSGPYSVFASGDFAYVGSYNNNRLCIFDLDKSNSMVSTPDGIQTAATQWQVGNNQTIYRSNGNVGIGTSTPSAKLDIAGQLLIEQNITGGLGGLLIKGNAPGSNYPNIAFSVNSGDTYPGAEVAALVQGDIVNNSMGSETIDMTFHTSQTGGFGITERMRIKGNGNIGMGTSAPSNKLTVAGNTDITGNLGVGTSTPTNRLSVSGNANITGNLGIGNVSPAKPLSFPASLGEKILLYPGGAGEVGIGVYGNELRLHADNPGAKVSFGTQDNAGIFTENALAQRNGVYAFSVLGSLWVNGTTYASDERFKQAITTISSPLQKLVQLKGVEYEMRTKEFPQYHFTAGRQIGLLAQNVETVVPEAVNEKDGFKGVDYARLVPLLIESIKEQQEQIKEFIRANEKMQQQVDALNRLVNDLQKK